MLKHRRTANRHVAVIGAGLSGLACARRLQAAALEVTVFESDGRVGGRLACWQDSDAVLDTGAQFMTVRTTELQQQADIWEQAGVLAQWQPRMPEPVADPWLVGVPAMTCLAEHLTHGLTVFTGTSIERISRVDQGWSLHTTAESLPGIFDAVVLATAPQSAARLIAGHVPQWEQMLTQIDMLPCWTVLLRSLPLDFAWDAQILKDGPISWWARQDSKPGVRSHPGFSYWVLHADAYWSRQHAHESEEHVADLMVKHFVHEIMRMNDAMTVDILHVQFWSHARRADKPQALLTDNLWDDTLFLGVCCDALSHSRVEQAYVSGHRLAQRILQSLSIKDGN